MYKFYVTEKPEFFDLKAEYYELFPDSNERTRQRDFEEMNNAGFTIYYSRKYKTFIFEDDDDDNGSQLLYFSQIYGEEVDFVGELENGDIDEEKVRKVEETYKVNLPEILKHMISLCTDDPENYLMCDDMNICRLLTMDEILHPKEKLDIDYISMGCVPVVDDLFGNNIVYCVEDEEWQLRDNIDESEGGSIHRRDEDVMSIIWDIWDVVDELSR